MSAIYQLQLLPGLVEVKNKRKLLLSDFTRGLGFSVSAKGCLAAGKQLVTSQQSAKEPGVCLSLIHI